MGFFRKEYFDHEELFSHVSFIKDFGKHFGERSAIALFVASITQIVRLLSLKIDNTIALGFFSWNQVVSDAIILGVQIGIFYLAFIGGVFVNKLILSEMKEEALKKKYRAIILIFEGIVFSFIPLLLFSLLDINAVLIPPVLLGLSFGFISAIKAISKFQKKIKQSFLGILLVLIVLIIYTYQIDFFDSLYAKIKEKEIDVQYVNDQYIFTHQAIYTKDGEVVFYKKINSKTGDNTKYFHSSNNVYKRLRKNIGNKEHKGSQKCVRKGF